ncbi:MAG TPA: STAS domain-containing protein [Actinomycetales bacterium]|jgi:anti-anti-sigma factor
MSTQHATSIEPGPRPAPATTARAEVVDVVPGIEVLLRGRLDVGAAGPVREALHHAVDTGHGDLVVHLDDVEVHDAAGLGVLVGAHRRARLAGRRLVLAGVPQRLERLIRHTRLHRVLVRSVRPAPVG